MSAGLCLSWFNREFGTVTLGGQRTNEQETLTQFVNQAASSKPGARGVRFLPFLEGAATPYQNPDLAASFYGFRTRHTKADAIRAVLEGVAFNVRDSVDLLEQLGTEIQEVRLSEGGSRSDLWCQIISDVLQRPVTTFKELDSSALGAAFLARSVATGEQLEVITDRYVEGMHGGRFEPDAAAGNALDCAYREYRDLVDAISGTH
jgi:xylulokinase